MLLEVDKLEVAYGDYQVVWGVSLGVAAGESVALLGPNGSGKSTVVNAITGLIAAKAGEIRFEGVSLVGKPVHHRAPLGLAHVLERRRVFPHLSVMQNLTLGAWHPAAKAARAKSIERVFSLFPRLSERQSQLARTLSGGEQQMLALGRGLMSLPRLLMVDEPFLGLAPQAMALMKATFDRLKSEGMAILLIEQNVRLALSMSNRGYVLESGRLAAAGTLRRPDRQPRRAADLSGLSIGGRASGFGEPATARLPTPDFEGCKWPTRRRRSSSSRPPRTGKPSHRPCRRGSTRHLPSAMATQCDCRAGASWCCRCAGSRPAARPLPRSSSTRPRTRWRPRSPVTWRSRRATSAPTASSVCRRSDWVWPRRSRSVSATRAMCRSATPASSGTTTR